MSHDPKLPLDEWPEHRAAPGFADGVMARVGAPPPGRRPVWLAAAVGGVAGAALVALLALAWRTPAKDEATRAAASVSRAPAAGRASPDAREEKLLSDAAVAVVEADAEVSWETRAGRVEVEQARGHVFYRAERPLAVRTRFGALVTDGGAASFSLASEPARTELVVYQGTTTVTTLGRSVVVGAGRRLTVTRRGPIGEGRAPWLDSPPAAGDAPGQASAALVGKPAPCDGGKNAESAVEDVATPSAATLAAWAESCRLHFDVAPIGWDAASLEDYLDRLGATAAERPVLREVIAAVEADYDRDLRRLYLDVTGDDAAMIERASSDWMFDQVIRSADSEEWPLVRRRLARERAGLAGPPADLAAVSPYEELVRRLMASGDVLERAVAAKLGAERARELRAKNKGWPGLRWDISGCPRE